MTSKRDYIVFLDAIGRTLIGVLRDETETHISVENPAVIHAQVDSNANQLSLHTFPLFFKEFQANRNQPTVWKFYKNAITRAESFPLAPKFVIQYEALFDLAETTNSNQNSGIIRAKD